MILCKYVGINGIDIMEQKRLKVSDPNDFNDPFELLPAVKPITDREAKKLLRDSGYLKRLYKERGYELDCSTFEQFRNLMKEKIKKGEVYPTLVEKLAKGIRETHQSLKINRAPHSLGIISFSNIPKTHFQGDILMWAHYADSHAGMRFWIDTKQVDTISTNLFKVEYKQKRPCLSWKTFANHEGENIKIYEEVLKSKSISWKYEKEFRFMIHPLECETIETQCYIKIKDKAICRVDLGINSSKELCEKVKSLAKKNKGVKVYKTKICDETYEIKYKKIIA